ncbi:hypothetical protein FH972_022832 [Carpinus fangiana]|uniref:Mediator of RNA polymerase II transcription subunit 31 n=1 Tax=Carpinus fangiana TaxID=176857 RepID=A0A5N6KTP9_9ROSI|nr:hypothetical protein FH972_022832 [Carpinus fangiana]
MADRGKSRHGSVCGRLSQSRAGQGQRKAMRRLVAQGGDCKAPWAAECGERIVGAWLEVVLMPDGSPTRLREAMLGMLDYSKRKVAQAREGAGEDVLCVCVCKGGGAGVARGKGVRKPRVVVGARATPTRRHLAAARVISSDLNMAGSDTYGGFSRFELELEHLAVEKYLDDPQFIAYLAYLQYFSRPEYARYLLYPGSALKALELLQQERFRAAILSPDTVSRMLEAVLMKQSENTRQGLTMRFAINALRHYDSVAKLAQGHALAKIRYAQWVTEARANKSILGSNVQKTVYLSGWISKGSQGRYCGSFWCMSWRLRRTSTEALFSRGINCEPHLACRDERAATQTPSLISNIQQPARLVDLPDARPADPLTSLKSNSSHAHPRILHHGRTLTTSISRPHPRRGPHSTPLSLHRGNPCNPHALRVRHALRRHPHLTLLHRRPHDPPPRPRAHTYPQRQNPNHHASRPTPHCPPHPPPLPTAHPQVAHPRHLPNAPGRLARRQRTPTLSRRATGAHLPRPGRADRPDGPAADAGGPGGGGGGGGGGAAGADARAAGGARAQRGRGQGAARAGHGARDGAAGGGDGAAEAGGGGRGVRGCGVVWWHMMFVMILPGRTPDAMYDDMVGREESGLGVRYGALGQQFLAAGALEVVARRLDDVVEQECAVHEQREADDLQPLEALPAKAQTDDPDEERAAGVDGAAACGAHAARHAQPEEVEAADTEHDEQRRHGDGAIVHHLAPARRRVKVAALAALRPSIAKMQNQLREQRHEQAKRALPAHNDKRDALRLRGRLRGVAWRRQRRLLDDAGQANNSNAEDDNEERGPLEASEVALQEDDAEEADEQHQRTACHLVDTGRHEEQADVHQRRAEDVADGGQREQDYAPAFQRLPGRLGRYGGVCG